MAFPSYFFHILLPTHTAPLLWVFITESSLPGDLGTCQKHQLSSNHQAEEREGDRNRGSLTHCQLSPAPSPRPGPAASPSLLALPAQPHSGFQAPSALLQDSSALRHPHPAPRSWDKAQSGRKINQAEGEGWTETRGKRAADLSGALGLDLLPAAYQLCDLRQTT